MYCSSMDTKQIAKIFLAETAPYISDPFTQSSPCCCRTAQLSQSLDIDKSGAQAILLHNFWISRMVDSKTPVETGAHTASERAKRPFYFVIYATIGFILPICADPAFRKRYQLVKECPSFYKFLTITA